MEPDGAYNLVKFRIVGFSNAQTSNIIGGDSETFTTRDRTVTIKDLVERRCRDSYNWGPKLLATFFVACKVCWRNTSGSNVVVPWETLVLGGVDSGSKFFLVWEVDKGNTMSESLRL